MMEYQAVIRIGRSFMKVTFSDGAVTAYGVNPATYTTDNLMVQHAIENSEQFKRGRIYVVNTTTLDKEERIVRNVEKGLSTTMTEQPEASPADDRGDAEQETTGSVEQAAEVTADVAEQPAEETTEECMETEILPQAGTEKSTELTPMEFDNNDDAKDFLVSRFGIVRSKLRLRADIVAAGEANGVAITFS